MAHIHAESMAQFAEDAKQMDYPWLSWEFRNSHDTDKKWSPLQSAPMWTNSYEYRRKLKYQKINFLIQDESDNVAQIVVTIPRIPLQKFILELNTMIKEKYNG